MAKNTKLKIALGAAFLLFVILHIRHTVSIHGHTRIPKQVLYSHYRICSKVNGSGVDCGTGIAIGPRQILTAAHVISDGETFELDLFDTNGKEIKTIPLRLVLSGGDKLDVALLESEEDLPVYNELDSDTFEVGSWGYIIGCAHATVPYNTYMGIFASKYGPRRFPNYCQIAVTVPNGESGGGVYSAESNKLVGICIASREGFTLFIPMDRILDFLAGIQK